MLKDVVKTPLRRELITVILLKLLLLVALKLAFFSDPPASRLTSAGVAQHLISQDISISYAREGESKK